VLPCIDAVLSMARSCNSDASEVTCFDTGKYANYLATIANKILNSCTDLDYMFNIKK